MTKIIAAAALATFIGCGDAHALYGDTFYQAQYDFELKLDREMHAMGECLVAQIKERGWLSHGPKDEIVARYSDYAERCYDAIKPNAMDPDGKASDAAKLYYIIAMQDALECHVDDTDAPERANEPMTCTEPTARKARERHGAPDYLARSRH